MMERNYILEYNAAIKTGAVRAGKWIIAIFTILSTGILSGRYLYSAEKADKAITFIEEFCHHSEGRDDLLKLELWQKAIVAAIFGVLDPANGRRQFREIFLVVARKNGKTLFGAAIMAYEAYIDGEYGSKLFCLAPKLEQADLAYEAFYQIVESDEDLARISKKRRSDIYIAETNTSIKKIAFNSKKSDGFNPQFTLNDEMEAWPGDQGLKQYDVMSSAAGARKEPIILSEATAGYVNDGIFDELFRRSTAFLLGHDAEDAEDRLCPFIFMIDDPEKWYTREELEKSNPNLGVSVSWEFYEEKIKIAKKSLSEKAEFLTKFCNVKQNTSIAWLNTTDVDRAAGPAITLEDFRGCYCVAVMDLSQITDLTAISLIIERGGIDNILTFFFMPAERYKIAIDEESVPYNIFREQGYLRICGEHQIDQHEIVAFFISLVKDYQIRPLCIGYDRYSATYIVEDLKAVSFHMDDVYQGTNLTTVLHAFEGELKDGKINTGNNNLLRSHLLNVAVNIDMNDSRMKPVKYNKRAHIDGAVSVFDALAVKMKHHASIGKMLENNPS